MTWTEWMIGAASGIVLAIPPSVWFGIRIGMERMR